MLCWPSTTELQIEWGLVAQLETAVRQELFLQTTDDSWGFGSFSRVFGTEEY
jgi:hypothetical protein